RWLRCTPAEVAKTSDGLDTRLLGLAPHESLTLRGLRSPAIHSLGRGLVSRLGGHRVRRAVHASGALGAITIRALEAPAFVDAGRAILRVWLRATTLGLAFAPVTVGAMMPLDLRFGADHRPRDAWRLREVETTLRGALGAAPGEHVAFVFRVGIPTKRP